MKKANGYLFIRFPDSTDITMFRWQPCIVEFGIDLSSGQGKDYAVITVAVFLTNNRIVVLKQFSGKWSIRDNSGVMSDKTALSRSGLTSIGVADEAYRLSRDFHPTTIKVGVASDEGSIRTEVERVFNVNGDYTTTILARPQTKRDKDKETRITTNAIKSLRSYAGMALWIVT